MMIAFVGKGANGKTTLSALFCRHLAARGHPVLAIDADINRTLAARLGLRMTASRCRCTPEANLPFATEESGTEAIKA
jgi:CO dehydrogenase nickel-insertion accessory protein CooC1